MKKSIWAGLFICLLALMVGCSAMTGAVGKSPTLAKIQKRGALVVGTSANMPPLNMTTKDGMIEGLDIDLARYMASAMGVELSLVKKNFDQLLPALQKGEVDMVISGMTITPERNMEVEFAGPYYVTGKAFLTKKETIGYNHEPKKFNSPDYCFVALKGSTSASLLKKLLPKARHFLAEDYDEAVEMVLSNRADAMVADYHACLLALVRNPDAGFVAVLTPFTYEPLGIALPPGDVHLLNWVNNFLSTMDGSDELAKLKLKWIESNDWIKKLP